MSTIRERLTADATTLFNTTFDKDVFLAFVEERLGKYHHLDIGIESDNFNEYLFEYTSRIPDKEIEKAVNEIAKDENKVISPFSIPPTYAFVSTGSSLSNMI